MIAIVAHDAGGAEILSSYVLQNKTSFVFVLDGPAIKVFLRKLPKLKIVTLAQALDSAESLLAGSSYPNDFELQAIKAFREIGKKTVTFLDHWINYKLRFIRDGREILPDQIWVGDTFAERKARKDFPNVEILYVEKPILFRIEETV